MNDSYIKLSNQSRGMGRDISRKRKKFPIPRKVTNNPQNTTTLCTTAGGSKETIYGRKSPP